MYRKTHKNQVFINKKTQIFLTEAIYHNTNIYRETRHTFYRNLKQKRLITTVSSDTFLCLVPTSISLLGFSFLCQGFRIIIIATCSTTFNVFDVFLVSCRARRQRRLSESITFCATSLSNDIVVKYNKRHPVTKSSFIDYFDLLPDDPSQVLQSLEEP